MKKNRGLQKQSFVKNLLNVSVIKAKVYSAARLQTSLS